MKLIGSFEENTPDSVARANICLLAVFIFVVLVALCYHPPQPIN